MSRWLWPLAGAASAAWYFTLLQPGHAGALLLFGALVAADLVNGFHAFSFWLTCLRRPRKRPFAAPAHAAVDVLVPTYNEPPDVLEPTLRGRWPCAAPTSASTSSTTATAPGWRSSAPASARAT